MNKLAISFFLGLSLYWSSAIAEIVQLDMDGDGKQDTVTVKKSCGEYRNCFVENIQFVVKGETLEMKGDILEDLLFESVSANKDFVAVSLMGQGTSLHSSYLLKFAYRDGKIVLSEYANSYHNPNLGESGVCTINFLNGKGLVLKQKPSVYVEKEIQIKEGKRWTLNTLSNALDGSDEYFSEMIASNFRQ